MKKYVCNVCGWIYDEQLGDADNGIQAGTKFEDLPEDFVCPLCGVGKEDFSEEEQIKNGQFTQKNTNSRRLKNRRLFFG